MKDIKNILFFLLILAAVLALVIPGMVLATKYAIWVAESIGLYR